MEIKYREVVVVYLLIFVTIGIYWIYWAIQTKEEINQFGGNIPTGWLLIIPIANIYWLYRYSEAFSIYVKKDNNAILWFILCWFVSIIMPALVQTELNKYANFQ